MKIQCNVCEAAEAAVLCCADEAALCLACDEKVHAANKLAGKHQRVSLTGSSSSLPKCDICQEAAGFFFCLQDRALLCRKCDVAIHTANTHVSSHQRFLLTGIKVGLEPAVASSSPMEIIQEPESLLPTRRDSQQTTFPHGCSHGVLQEPAGGVSGFGSMKVQFPDDGSGSPATIPQWQLDDFLELTEFNQSFGYTDHNGSSKADCSKSGDSQNSSLMRSAEEELNDNECLGGEMLEMSWAVPEIPSPPTASGLYWPRRPHSQYNHADSSFFVPDIFSSTPGDSFRYRGNTRLAKRRRHI